MIILSKSDDNKLVIMRNGNMECKPWGMNTGGENSEVVKISSLLDRESTYEAHFSGFAIITGGIPTAFTDLSSLLEYITPCLGFKTASGGSGAVNKEAELIKTGQIISYDYKDDGALQLGRGVNFSTLWENNVFGNTNRFTDINGEQDYDEDIVLDHSTYNGETILGYSRTPIVPDSWDSQLQVCGEEPGWSMTNIRQLQNITNYGETSVFSYPPFNFPTNVGFFTSTTVFGNTANVFLCQSAGWIGTAGKGVSNYAIRCKYYTKAELGF